MELEYRLTERRVSNGCLDDDDISLVSEEQIESSLKFIRYNMTRLKIKSSDNYMVYASVFNSWNLDLSRLGLLLTAEEFFTKCMENNEFLTSLLHKLGYFGLML
jgi:hypothetical protein